MITREQLEAKMEGVLENNSSFGQTSITTSSCECTDVAISFAIDELTDFYNELGDFYEKENMKGIGHPILSRINTIINKCHNKISELQSLLKQPQQHETRISKGDK